jgi:hypothetical protein
MKKRSLILMTVLMLTLLSLPITAVSAQPNKHIECVADATFDLADPSYCWHGKVSGCSISGHVDICELPAIFPGHTEHFFETFTIVPDSGGEIRGVDAGVWNFSTSKFRANGWVTYASEEYEYLVGFKLHEMGTVSGPDEYGIYTISNAAMTLH